MYRTRSAGLGALFAARAGLKRLQQDNIASISRGFPGSPGCIYTDNENRHSETGGDSSVVRAETGGDSSVVRAPDS